MPFPIQIAIPVIVQSSYNLYANGSVNLTSTDPFAPTILNSNYFVVDEDIHIIKYTIKNFDIE